MISPYKISWNGLSSLDFDLWTELSIDGDDNGNTSTFLNREAVTSEHYDGSRRTIHSFRYQDVLEPTITLVKQNYEDFTQDENRKILSWLTSHSDPSWLDIFHDDSNTISYRLFGGWSEIEQHKLSNGRVIGYTCTFTSNSPMAWSRKFIYPEIHTTIEEINNNDETNDYLQVSGEKQFTITCNTDEYNKPLYPKVTITFKGKNDYFPIDVNPQEDNTYHMVPNVIYSWKEEYRRAVGDEKDGTIYYSDKNGTKANPQPKPTEVVNGEFYIYVNEPHYYVNLNGVEDNGKYEIEIIEDETPPKVTTENSGAWRSLYYYFPNDGNTIQKLNNSNNTYTWKIVSRVGLAAKINSTHIPFNGEPITTESIIAGGVLDEAIVLDGTNKVISGTKSNTTRIIGDDFNWNWIPFYSGDNTITVSGNCEIKFEWLEPRKVGSL